MTRSFIQKVEKRKNDKILCELKKSKEVFKIKKFKEVESKLKENLKEFKTYLPDIFNKKKNKEKNLEDLIQKVEQEIKLLEEKKGV